MRHLKINSLPSVKTWVDRDTIMLHACFQILEDFIEKEKGDTACNYEHHKEDIDEIRFLYNWWMKRKVTIYRAEIKDSSGEKEDNEMLLRLVKIREFLWT